jgi:hypothetical protein
LIFLTILATTQGAETEGYDQWRFQYHPLPPHLLSPSCPNSSFP